MKDTLKLLTLASLIGFAVSTKAEELPFKDDSFKAIEYTQPDYPESARLKGIQGTVFVECLIAPDGSILAADAEEGANPLLAASAVKAVQTWKFKALSQNESPMIVRIPISFELRANLLGDNKSMIATR